MKTRCTMWWQSLTKTFREKSFTRNSSTKRWNRRVGGVPRNLHKVSTAKWVVHRYNWTDVLLLTSVRSINFVFCPLDGWFWELLPRRKFANSCIIQTHQCQYSLSTLQQSCWVLLTIFDYRPTGARGVEVGKHLSCVMCAGLDFYG